MDSVPTVAAAPIIWQPSRDAVPPPWPVPSLGVALLRGLKCTCPACGKTKLFRGYLRVVDDCANCGAPLGSVSADDAPPYFTIFVVGHIVVPGMFMLDRSYDLPDWIQAAIWVPVTTILAVGLLRPIKGATVGLMLKLGLLKARDEADNA
jgi:uncharacterized protein (DUF983 family)